MLILPRTLWIAEEKELVHEIAGLGELRQPWLVDKTFFLAFDMFHSSSPIILHFPCFPFSISVCHHFPSSGLGELRQPWSVLFYLYPVESTSIFFLSYSPIYILSDRHSSQMRWLENHLNLINTYSVALENLDNYRGMTKMMMITRIDWSDDADEKKVEDDVGALALLTSIPAFLSIAN